MKKIFCVVVVFIAMKAVAQKQPVMVNQMGYNTHAPKWFTTPRMEKGLFVITSNKDELALFEGKIVNNKGDFTGFQPGNAQDKYVVRVRDDRVHKGISVPFSVGPTWLEEASYKPALDFMIDARSLVGTHASAVGGTPWRDGAYYTFETPSLIMQLMANPGLYLHLPVTMHYAADKKRLFSPDFHLVIDSLFLTDQQAEAYTTIKKYYTELDPPVGSHVPDIVQLIHYGIGFYIINPVGKDPSRDTSDNVISSREEKIHPQTLEQFAFFLYAYPLYKQYFTHNFYKKAYDLAFNEWEKTGLFKVIDIIGNGKGRECPGHSILPNLMMYEVAQREGRNDAERFFDAAYNETKWVISEVDFHDPETTKGQRMSEHKLMPGLVFFLQKYPERAPKGLQEKINEWAKIMIARSNNMWDFRRYDTLKNWSIPRYNEPGNLAGFPACALPAATVIQNKAEKDRLLQISYAQWDNLFGRNPLNAASPNYPQMGFPYLEKGWPEIYPPDLCGRLETSRGTLNSSGGTEIYPYNPDGKLRHSEGWTAFNAAWNVGLAYLSWTDTQLSIKDADYNKDLSLYDPKESLCIALAAPLNRNNKKIETGEVIITASNGLEKKIQVKETASYSSCFHAAIPFQKIVANSANLPEWIEISYGFGLFRKGIRLNRAGKKYVIVPL